MRAITNDDGRVHEDLSTRLADNVVEALVDYLAAPGMATGYHVQVLSAALQSLATLATAEQLQALVVALEPDDEDDDPEYDAKKIMEMWP